MDSLEKGSLFGGRYRILSELGKGGVGAVYRAHHEFLDRDVAIKVLRNDLLVDKEAMARFRREAKAASRVKHVNITEIFDFGHTDAGVPYLAMEFVEGVTLAEEIARHGPFSLPRAHEVLLQVLRGLGAAHVADVVHRDLKPENIMLCEGDHVKILDFGLAKILVADATQVTQEGVFGTPEYLSPEQIIDETVDHRCDIYNFGLLTYEMLVGNQPFTGEVVELLHLQVETKTPKASETSGRAELAPGYDALIARCTEKNPAERYQSAEEVAAALQALEV